MIWTDVIDEQILGTGTAKTQLSGAHNNAASNLIVQQVANSVLDVHPYLVIVTPTTAQSVICTLKIETGDIKGFGTFEVYATPLGSGTTAVTMIADPSRMALYKFMQNCPKGTNLAAYGVPQIANTVAPYMGAEITLSDGAAPESPYYGKVGGAEGGGGANTSAGTTANTNVVGKNISLTSAARIKSVFGYLAQTTVVTVKPNSGYFLLTETAMEVSPIRYIAEPVQSSLTTVDTSVVHLTRSDGLDIGVAQPATIAGSLQAGLVDSTAANFGQGILYQQ